MEKVLSGFSITKGNVLSDEKSEHDKGDPIGDNPFDGMDAKQTERMMKELESTVSGMDEENPDPRQMGSLMRRLSEMSGEKIDGQMEEVVRKLEEGMDPNQLEEQMQDFTEDQPEECRDGEEAKSEIKKHLRRLLKKRVVRDPTLYEFSEYVQD